MLHAETDGRLRRVAHRRSEAGSRIPHLPPAVRADAADVTGQITAAGLAIKGHHFISQPLPALPHEPERLTGGVGPPDCVHGHPPLQVIEPYESKHAKVRRSRYGLEIQTQISVDNITRLQ